MSSCHLVHLEGQFIYYSLLLKQIFLQLLHSDADPFIALGSDFGQLLLELFVEGLGLNDLHVKRFDSAL
jgi:hypothetical protein